MIMMFYWQLGRYFNITGGQSAKVSATDSWQIFSGFETQWIWQFVLNKYHIIKTVIWLWNACYPPRSMKIMFWVISMTCDIAKESQRDWLTGIVIFLLIRSYFSTDLVHSIHNSRISQPSSGQNNHTIGLVEPWVNFFHVESPRVCFN